MTPIAPVLGRLAALGLLGGILQLTAVAQVTVFGVPADLSPLLVAAVGLLMGSVPGALFGFAVGLFVDTALLQGKVGLLLNDLVAQGNLLAA